MSIPPFWPPIWANVEGIRPVRRIGLQKRSWRREGNHMQKTLAYMKTRRRCVLIDCNLRYWAVGVGVGKGNYHLQVGPFGLSLSRMNTD